VSVAGPGSLEELEQVGVLICDDAEAMRLLLRVIVSLERQFCVVGEASNGREAISFARELQPDVILLDLSMPVCTGLEALPEIRLAAPAAAVVVFSGLDESIVGDAAREAGATRFLQKGASPDAILATITGAHADRQAIRVAG
jgi:DNA-binding NarL/FixJ family response regulator